MLLRPHVGDTVLTGCPASLLTIVVFPAPSSPTKEIVTSLFRVKSS